MGHSVYISNLSTRYNWLIDLCLYSNVSLFFDKVYKYFADQIILSMETGNNICIKITNKPKNYQ